MNATIRTAPAIEIDYTDIRELRVEARSAGDADMVAICTRALADGDESDAWRECERVIEAARAMRD